MWPFPSKRVVLRPEYADENGLVAIGGDLRPQRLIDAYSHGIFPWYGDDWPICWWCPDPRGILDLDRFHVSRRLKRTIRTERFRITYDRAFDAVIEGCAETHWDGTWITPDMLRAYRHLHRLGIAHSVEAWDGDELAGGVYGVAIGGFFAGESMFHHRRDASKVALVHLVERLRHRGFLLFDVQFSNDHTAQFGALDIPRTDYLKRLRRALAVDTSF